MSTTRTSRLAIEQLRERLSPPALAIVADVAELRLMSARQIEALHFPPSAGVSAASAARQCRRALHRLVAARVLLRLERRIGGVRAGSAAFIYGLGPVGHRLAGAPGARPRRFEPALAFVEHQLAVSQLVVDARLAARAGRFELVELQAEPTCWRTLPGYGRAVLRPDLLLAVANDDLEYRWFIELDRATHHAPAMRRKARLYETYYRSGVEQATHEVFPRVLWIVPDAARAERLHATLATASLPRGLMLVTTTPDALDVLAGSRA